MNAAEAIVQILIDSGVRHIFGLPGDTSMDLYEAFHRHRDDLTHILTRDERSASFMADAYARVSGRLGVVESPSGGGATYVVPGIAEAQGSSSPILSITTDVPISEEGRNVLTELDQESLFRPITKWSIRVKTSGSAPDVLRRAIRVATSGRPGAVSMILPADVVAGPVEDVRVYGVPELIEAPSFRSRPDPDSIAAAADLIDQSDHPIIVAGGGVVVSGAWEELTLLAETLKIPVATSINGKGSVPETSPISIGVAGGNGGRAAVNQAVAAADLVIMIGTRTESVTTNNWSLPAQFGPKIIHIDVDPVQPGNTYQTQVSVVGDAKLALRDLLEAVDTSSPRIGARSEWIDAIQERRDVERAEVNRRADSLSQPIKPQRVIRALRSYLEPETVIVADPGTPTPFISADYPLPQAGRWTVIPRAHGGLGYAIPAVVGAYYAAGGRRVVGLCGDGSFGMSAGELETISRLGLPITLVHFNNAAFGWIKELQHLYHQQHYHLVDFTAIDYVAVAHGFGLWAEQVTDPAEVDGVVRRALEAGKPAFVDVVSELPLTETPPVSSWEEAVAAQGASK